MRILHTSDWHVGRAIRGRSRAPEHEAVLDEIVAIADRERVDLVLVAGDQFDVSAPAPDAERIVYRTLMALAETGARVVVVAGNHDNPHRLSAVAPLLAGAGVHAVAALARPEDGGVVDVEVASGELARVALIPFLSQRNVVRADELMGLDADQHAGMYDSRVQAIIERLCAGFGSDTVNILAGHLMAAGGVTGGGERSAHTIFDYYVSTTGLPPSAHYVALGHLHRCQKLPAAVPAWYCGSPLQLDFGEAEDDKVVLVVDAAPGTPARVEPIPLRAGRRLRTVRGTPDELEALAGTTGDDYLRVVVHAQAVAGLADQVREWLPEAVDVRVEGPERRERPPPPPRLGRSSRELFGDYLAEHGQSDERVLALFAELLEEVQAGGDRAPT